jgi:sRNA-binding regulator protein Hfq
LKVFYVSKRLLIKAENFTHDRFLKMLCVKNATTKIYLRNGITLQGFIENFDKEVVI